MLHPILDAVILKVKMATLEGGRDTCEEEHASEPRKKRFSNLPYLSA